MIKKLRSYLFSGILVWVPILLTIVVFKFVVGLLIDFSDLFPPIVTKSWLGINVPGIPLAVALLVVLATGLFANNFIGKRFAKLWTNLAGRIPIFSPVYKNIKRIMQAFTGNKSFSEVYLVQYPRDNCWTIAFNTSKTSGAIAESLGEGYLNLFVPTTPNPTSGFFIISHKDELKKLDISVDTAIRMVISAGAASSQES